MLFIVLRLADCDMSGSAKPQTEETAVSACRCRAAVLDHVQSRREQSAKGRIASTTTASNMVLLLLVQPTCQEERELWRESERRCHGNDSCH
jgi:hypothetical protein